MSTEPEESENTNVALAYLLGGVALLAISVLPLLVATMDTVQPVGKLVLLAYWLAGALAISWAVRRFTKLGERVAALIGVVVGWYIVLQILLMVNTMLAFRF